MTMTAHTPGPWRYERTDGIPANGRHMISGAVPGYLAEVRDCVSGDVQANARLIAAAPDTLHTLRIAREFIAVASDCTHHADSVFNRSDFDVVLAQIDAAIAKATGGQP